MSSSILPENRLRISAKEILALLKPYKKKLAKHEVFMVAVRGYYKNTGIEADSEIPQIYQDALFVYSPSALVAFHANTDPRVKRRKTPTDLQVPVLQAGLWLGYRFENYKGKKEKYPALIQKEGTVTVIRDGSTETEELEAGMDILKGAVGTTSPNGCQAIQPAQWDSFYSLVRDQAMYHNGSEWRKMGVPYLLLDAMPS
jgi:hypothetical protein